MKQIRYTLINGVFLSLLYFGFIEEVGGAYNVAMFFAWVTIAASVISINDSVIKEKAKDYKLFISSYSYDIRRRLQNCTESFK